MKIFKQSIRIELIHNAKSREGDKVVSALTYISVNSMNDVTNGSNDKSKVDLL